MDDVLAALYQTILSRKEAPVEGSYTSYLFGKGVDKILKKIGEECSETIIAAKNGVENDVVCEISDLTYHVLVLMAEMGIPLEAVREELARRAEKQGNLKEQKQVDRNS